MVSGAEVEVGEVVAEGGPALGGLAVVDASELDRAEEVVVGVVADVEAG